MTKFKIPLIIFLCVFSVLKILYAFEREAIQGEIIEIRPDIVSIETKGEIKKDETLILMRDSRTIAILKVVDVQGETAVGKVIEKYEEIDFSDRIYKQSLTDLPQKLNEKEFVIQEQESPNEIKKTGAVKLVAVGDYHVCALFGDGRVKCWGGNTFGEFGTGTTKNSFVPVSSLIDDVTSVAADGFYTCALLTTGDVKCWGYNIDGQLGNGTTENSFVPVSVSGLSNGVTALEVGSNLSCAVIGGGDVMCWGDNFYGKLGTGTGEGPEQCGEGLQCSTKPVFVSGLSGKAVSIAIGLFHVCALLSDGTVRCWGDNINGQLGNGTTTNSLAPVSVTDLSNVSAISSGLTHTCALLNTGGIKCWGNNTDGQLGNGTTTNSLTPVDVSGLTSGVSILSSGSDSNCAVLVSGNVKCWGGNTRGKLGIGSETGPETCNNVNLSMNSSCSTLPADVKNLSNVIAIDVGGNNTSCAILFSGDLKCWGDNSSGQLGTSEGPEGGKWGYSTIPVSVSELL